LMTLLGAQKVFWKMHVTHAASECLQPWSFRTDTASLMIITLSAAWISLTALELCIFILLVVLMARLGF
jgi:hypothetical protein